MIGVALKYSRTAACWTEKPPNTSHGVYVVWANAAGAKSSASRKNRKSVLVNRYDLFKKFWGERQTRNTQPLHEVRRSAGAAKASQDAAIIADASLFENENVLNVNLKIGQSQDFRNVSNSSGTIAE